MWLLPLLIAAHSWPLVWATPRNSTIDDASPQVKYQATFMARNPAGFDTSQLHDGTVTFIHPDPNGSPTISIDFSGIAVYVFVAYPSGKPSIAPVGFVAQIDGVPSGQWTAHQMAPLNNYLAFHQVALSNAPHTLLLTMDPIWSLYFDYAIVTTDTDGLNAAPTSDSTPPQHTAPATNSDTGDPASPSSPSPALPQNNTFTVTSAGSRGPGSTLTASGSTLHHTTTLITGSSATNLATAVPSTSGASSSQNTPNGPDAVASAKKVPAGAVVGGVLGGMLLMALVSALLVRRRRARMAKRAAESKLNPFILIPEERGTEEVFPPSSVMPSPALTRFTRWSEKSPLSVHIPPRVSEEIQTAAPFSSASDPALTRMAEEMHRITMSVQRLETGIPEARDGGPILQRPPAYGRRQEDETSD
ncbi:hypothetical protein C8R43DRAFT_1230501 [Mycena crocata]|nr:hypothetical protein C8R43DRAFT_1230501 [Mycena crocata]